MTDKEKQIYNTYLAVTRSKQNKPFKLRKDFSSLEQKKEYNILKRLTSFFIKYPHITPSEFFSAPYSIHTDSGHLPLDYFLTRPAIKVYSLYMKKLQDSSPANQIEFIRSSFQYIGMFCLKNKIYLDQYLYHKTGCIHSWMSHYREHHISIYSLFELGDVAAVLNSVPSDEKTLLTEDLQQTVIKYKTRYFTCFKTKTFAKECTAKIQKFLKESLLQSAKSQLSS